MATCTAIDTITNSAQNVINTVTGQVEDLNSNLLELTSPAMFTNSDLNTSYGVSYYTPVEFTPGLAGQATAAPEFTATAPLAPELDVIPTDIAYDLQHAGSAPDIDTNFNIDDIDTSALRSITVPKLDTLPTPTMGEYSIPDIISIDDIVIPPVPDFAAIPAFDSSEITELDSPTLPTLAYSEEEYVSSLQDAADEWLQDIIANGGTGLGADIEQAIYDRSLTRETSSFRDNVEEAANDFAASGFPRPTGALRARMDRIRADFQNRTEDLNRKIQEEQARIAVETSKFVITEALRLEATRMQYETDLANRSLEVAKEIVKAHQAVYGLKVAEYNARIEKYKADATVYRDIVQASLVEVEKYKVTVDTAKVSADVQRLKIQNYTEQMQGAKLIVDIYKSEIDAAKVYSEIEALKLDKYRIETEAAKINIDAQVMGLEGTKIKIMAQEAKLTAFQAETAAVKSANDAEMVSIEAQKSIIDAKISSNKKKLETFQIQSETFKNLVQAHSARVESFKVSQQAILAIAQKDSADAKLSADIQIKNNELDFQVLKASNEMNVLSDKYAAEADIKTLEAQIGGATTGMQHYLGVSAAALSQVNQVIQTYQDYTEN